MPRTLAELFGGGAESLRKRKGAEEYDPNTLRSVVKALGSAIAESEETSEDHLILAAAPAAFKTSYPRYEPWQGADLLMLLSKMRNLIHETASGRPVLVYELDEAMEFCAQMRAELLTNHTSPK